MKGAAITFTVLVIGSMLLAVFLALALTGLLTVTSADEQARAYELRALTFGCLDEVLINLQADSGYVGTSVNVGSITCAVAVTSPVPDTREVLVTGAQGDLTRRLRAQTTVEPVAVTSLAEE